MEIHLQMDARLFLINMLLEDDHIRKTYSNRIKCWSAFIVILAK